jgi:ABC-type nitrate/sulfonate/bicarbonate transport system permease component
MEQAARMTDVYAAVFLLSAVGYSLNWIVVTIEKRALPWNAARIAA